MTGEDRTTSVNAIGLDPAILDGGKRMSSRERISRKRDRSLIDLADNGCMMRENVQKENICESSHLIRRI